MDESFGSEQFGTAMQPSMTRRILLRRFGLGIGVVYAGSLFAACGNSSKSDSTKASSTTTGSGQPTAATGASTAAATESGTTGPSTATATATEPGTSANPITLAVGANFQIVSLDPARGAEPTTEMINHATYDSLVTYDGEDLSTPKPSLAQKWEVAPDGKTYTFTLQQNVKFVSGNPLTSADFKWSLDRVQNMDSISTSFLTAVNGIQAPSPDTVVITLPSSYPGIISILSNAAMGAVDSKLVMTKGGDSSADAKDKDTAEPYLSQNSAGTGAFTLTSYTPDDQVTLVKNPNHWRGASPIDRIVVKNITDAASQKTQIMSGSIDIATGLSQDQIPGLKNAQGVVVKTTPAVATFYVLMNNNPDVGGAFSNPKVQQAVRYALDYDGILKLAGEGSVRLAGVIPNNLPGAVDPKNAITRDVDMAKRLLSEANLDKVSGAITFPVDGVDWGIQYAILAQKVQADLSEVGMQISLDGLPAEPSTQKYRGGKVQIGIFNWTADWTDASDYLVYAPGRTIGKRAGWLADADDVAKELADLANQAETEVDDTKRIQLYEEWDKKINDNGPYAPLFSPSAPYAYRSNITGVTYHSVWKMDFFTIKKSS